MKLVLLCVVALVMVAQLPREGDAVCCYGKGLAWNIRCKDCSKGTPFCAKGKSCNIFGCNCMGGCRDGPCPSPHHHHPEHVKPVYEAPVGQDYDGTYESMPNGAETAVPASDDYDGTYESMPNGAETAVPASNDYDVPATGESPASELEKPSSNDGDVSEYERIAGDESEMSSEMKVPESDVTSGSESEMSSSDGYDASAVDSGYDDASSSDGSASEITSADDVVRSADENRDGYMDIDEAEKFLVKRGLATSGYRAKRSLMAIDLNNDNYISAEEIELYED